MTITSKDLPSVLVSLYAQRTGTLMAPVFGVVVRTGRGVYACSVAHAVDDRDDAFAVWGGIHPDVARSYGLESAARCLADVDLRHPQPGIIYDEEADLMAVPLGGYEGASLDAYADFVEGDVGVLQPALITFPDHEPDDHDILQRGANGIAGLVSWEDSRHCVVSVEGSMGMSGSPVLIARGGALSCIGLYTGTRRVSDLTPQAAQSLAQVAKMGAFVRNLDGQI